MALPEYSAVTVSPLVSPALEISLRVAMPLESVVAVPTGVVLVPSKKLTVSPEIALPVTFDLSVATNVTVPPLALLPEPETELRVVPAWFTTKSPVPLLER